MAETKSQSTISNLTRTMSKLIDDAKTGLKGIRGAGDALRGGAMGALDQAVHTRENAPETAAAQQKNAAITERGAAEMQQAENAFESRRNHQPTTTTTTTGTAAPSATTTPAATTGPTTDAHKTL
ncbi:hypothetical protein F4780DRAFT_752970 [Xylariomycetidae sp. FL0641]|nr:hypothetical protein F4780DRAFT_752970 [Xylariomycetidae sp. FL0641]